MESASVVSPVNTTHCTPKGRQRFTGTKLGSFGHALECLRQCDVASTHVWEPSLSKGWKPANQSISGSVVHSSELTRKNFTWSDDENAVGAVDTGPTIGKCQRA